MTSETRNGSALDIVDHINGNGLDNRKENLRVVTVVENARNSRGKVRSRKSQYKGVSFCIGRKSPWRATIEAGGHGQKHLGYFSTEEEAARAYDQAAAEVFGEFAFLNFPAAT
jgi:hypothetical protein